MKSLDPSRAEKIFIRKKLGLTAVSASDTIDLANTLLFQFTNINKCKAGTSISADTKCVHKTIIYIKIHMIL